MSPGQAQLSPPGSPPNPGSLTLPSGTAPATCSSTSAIRPPFAARSSGASPSGNLAPRLLGDAGSSGRLRRDDQGPRPPAPSNWPSAPRGCSSRPAAGNRRLRSLRRGLFRPAPAGHVAGRRRALLAQRVWSNAAECLLPSKHGPLELTRSLGIAEVAAGDDEASLLGRAEAALQAAGCNRICCHDGGTTRLIEPGPAQESPLSLRNIMQQLAAAAGVCGDWKMKRVRVDTCLAVPYTKETRYGTRTLEGVISPGKVLRQSPVLEAGSLFSISKLWQCSSGRSCMTGPLAGPATRRIGLKACII